MGSYQSEEKTSGAYWETLWHSRHVPEPVDPYRQGIGNHIYRQWHAIFHPLFSKRSRQSIIEIGCAGSPWLPYFSRQFDLKVTGLDRSLLGCKQAEEVLSQLGVKGQIFNADLFFPPGEILETFDVVISFGVVEHFVETEKVYMHVVAFFGPAV